MRSILFVLLLTGPAFAQAKKELPRELFSNSGFVSVALLADDFFKVSISRVDQDIYEIQGTNLHIATQYCYEYVFYEDAILQYRAYALDNKLIFGDGQSCAVRKVF